jgi:hypothetical protein
VIDAAEILRQREEYMAAQEEAAKKEAIRVAAAYVSCFTTKSGMDVLEVLGQHLNGNTFRRDPYEAAYEAGRRSVYMDILTAIADAQATMEAVAVDRVADSMQTQAILPGSIEEL